jgi:hypothetical protein
VGLPGQLLGQELQRHQTAQAVSSAL